MGARAIFFLAVGFPLCACVGDRMPDVVVNMTTRDLSPAEKTMLAHSLSDTLKDPDSAKFEWVPVKYVLGSHGTDYCGRLNAKNSYGGYTGFTTFHAIINLDDKGQYSTGRIDSEDATEKCARTGYIDFSQAK
jgi:hypothetical protein